MVKPAQNSLRLWLTSLARDKADTLLLVLSCTLVLAPFSWHSPWWINLAAGWLILWRCWITLAGKTLPPKWLLTLISLVLLAGIYWHFETWLGKDAGIAFLLVLACLKMLEMQARRDAAAVVFVCYFLLAGQLLYSQQLLSALYLLLCLCLLVSAQLTFQYHQTAPPLFKRVTSGFKIVGLAIPLALILFLLFPRIQGPLWGKSQGNAIGISGLSDSMEPGNMAELALSDQIAFRVNFHQAAPPAAQLYWRGVVLDKFDGHRWSINNPATHLVTMPAEQGMQITQEIILEPHNQRWLFALDRPSHLLPSSNQTAELTPYLTRYFELRNSTTIQERIRYTVVSNLLNNVPETNADIPTRKSSDTNLLLPEGFNPLTLQWAGQLRHQANNPLQAANLVLQFFRTQPFRYTASPPPLGENQVDDFLFATQAGFCEHYASAFVIVMRAMGIPARVVTGYQGGEINPIDDLMTVRQADAHAWAEIWLSAKGWVRVDPTAAVAPNRVEHGSRFSSQGSLLNFGRQNWLLGLSSELQARWDATNSAWNLWALNYNLDKQKNLLTALSGIEHPQAAQLGVAMMAAASLVIGIISLFLLKRTAALSPADKLYARFCQHMARHGYPRLPYEGSQDYFRRLHPHFPRSKELEAFLNLYTQHTFGRHPSPGDLHNLKHLLNLCCQLKPLPV